MEKETNDRLHTAQWVFERTLGWIAAAEVKVAAICAIDTAMLAALGAVYIAEENPSAWAFFFSLAALVLLFIGIFCAAMVLIPRLDGGPTSSRLYFGKIAELPAEEFRDGFIGASDEELLRDWTDQIHQNSRIAKRKHDWVRKCLYFSLLGSLPWLMGVISAVKHPLT